MTYLGLLEVLEAAARTVAPTATYYRGRLSDVSLDSHDANEVIIYVLDTMRIEPDANNIFERWNIRIGFFKQDSTSSESMTVNQVQSGEQSREDIFSDMHILAREYYDALFNEENIQIVGQPSYSQLTRELQGTYSGWGLDIGVLIEVGCEQTEINDAIYQNAETNPNFQQSIKRGEVYVAPQITVTDSDQSQYLQDANTDVVCTPSASPATAILDDTVGNEISITSIPPGTTEHITAPDGTINLVNTDNDPIQTETVRSNQTKSATIPNVAWTDSDGSAESTPYGNPITCTPQQALSVDFSANDTTPETNQTVTFTDLTTGATTWLWDFGDNESSDLQNPTHEYKYAGTYTVTLHADNGIIGGYEEKVGYITVTLQTLYQTSLQMWNKAPTGAAPSNMTLVAGAVSQWNDEINGYDRTQGTAASRPTYNSTGYTAPDGTVYGTVEYDGTNDTMKNNSAGLTRGAGSYEVILIRIRAATNGTRVYFEAGNASLYESYMLVSGGIIYSALVFYQSAASSVQSAGIVSDEWVLVKIHWNGASSSIQIDNLTKTVITNNIGTGAAQGSTQGATQAGTNHGKVDILEHAIYSAKPSDADVTAYIDNYFNSKFGLWE